jgi:arylsulfatase A
MRKKLSNSKLDSSLFVCFLLFSFTECKKDFNQISNVSSTISRNAVVTDKPNIILFIANDFGFELPTYNGGQSYSTPNLDFMAANGLLFQQAYNHPDGSPSRMAILTGEYNFRNYVKWGYLPPGQKTIGNMLRDNAQYATCWVGKWQLNGGDKRIRGTGFNKYLVYLPIGYGQREHRYKDPYLYENAAYLPDSVTAGKYSEDMLYDYLANFIDSNRTKPFFAVYATLLPAQPWVPTPDDPDYPTWNSANDGTLENKKYFPGMVSYIDKIVGQVIQKLQDDGIADNTIIMWTSATQSDKKIISQWRGQTVTGTKTNTSKAGTNIPLLVYWPSQIPPGSRSQTLVDFTDFLPTLADIAHIPLPTDYGILDGTSFYDNMMNFISKDRDWVFCHWDNNPIDNVPPERFINDTTYKLYDTVGKGNGKFYKISEDFYEKNPIPDSALTPEELQRKQYFRSILDTMHK